MSHYFKQYHYNYNNFEDGQLYIEPEGSILNMGITTVPYTCFHIGDNTDNKIQVGPLGVFQLNLEGFDGVNQIFLNKEENPHITDNWFFIVDLILKEEEEG